jgi:hypothetical protein
MTDQATRQGGQWVQPEHRQCVHLHGSGERCKGTPKTGEKFCHAHQRFAETDPMYPVKVPLLEDPDSIRFVSSQTVRALAMGTIPPANARSMLYGCHMAFDLLQFEFAREKFRARERREEEARAARTAMLGPGPAAAPEVIGPQPVAPLEPTVVEECAAESGTEEFVESPICQSQALMEHPKEADDAEPNGEPEPAAGLPSAARIVPRFPDLREQWDTGLARAERTAGRNLQRKDDESGESWLARQRAPFQAGHPQARRRCAGDPAAEAHEGSYGPNELPFDPACPPGFEPGLMDGWLPEHIAAWMRALSPKLPEKEVREFVRAMWDLPHADERAGWPRPAKGRDPMAAPPKKCIFWKMSVEEIAAWLRAQVPDATEREAQYYAEERARRMEEIRRLRGEDVEEADAPVAPTEGEVVGA